MRNSPTLISSSRINRIKAQGYCNYSDANLSELAFGNRFAYIICSIILLIGVTTANIPILATLMIISLFGVILPYHPFDNIYNHLLRGVVNKPKLPPRSKQLKFACTIATIWIGIHIYLFYVGLTIAGYVSGGLMFSITLLVSTTDFCIPSTIYNLLFKVQV